MTETKVPGPAADPSMRMALIFFCLLLTVGFWTMASGWRVRAQSAVREREVQTLLSAHFIQQENDFSPAYPVPVVGRPWAIPVEFPFYQWAAVVVSNLTGQELAATGRALGLLCFYLALPALFLALRDLGLTPAVSLIGLGLLGGNAFCLDQAAAFHSESMAVMLAAWLLAGLMRGLTTGRLGWFGLATLAGAAAGVMHPRTLGVFQVLAVGGVLLWLVRHRAAGLSLTLAAGWVAASILPWVAVVRWTHYAAAIRHLNPQAENLATLGVTGLGFAPVVSSAEQMRTQLALVGTQAVWWPLLVLGAILAITFSERWWRQVLVCAAGFFVAQVLFPVMQGPQLHEAFAGTVCLLVALGLVLAGLFDATLPRWTGPVALVLFAALGFTQIYRSPRASRSVSPLEQLGQALQQAVLSNAYLVTVAARDTGLGLPLAAQRRTLNLTPAQAENEASVRAALVGMGSEPLGAIVLRGNPTRSDELVPWIAKQAGTEMQRAFTYREWTVYLPKLGVRPALDRLMIGGLPEVVLAAELLPKAGSLAGEWQEMAKLWGFQRAFFRAMQPAPASFYSSHGPGLMGGDDGENWYNAHPVTRLRFRLAPGPHRLQTRVMMQPATFDPELPPNERTDGVDFQLVAVDAEDNRQVLYSRLIDPVRKAADRQPQAVDLPFTLPPGAELEIYFGPGPARQTTRDWVYLGRLRID